MVGGLDLIAVVDVGAADLVEQLSLGALAHLTGELLATLDDAVLDRVEHAPRVVGVVDVVGLLAVELDHDVPRRDAFVVEELAVDLRLDPDVLTAGDAAEARAEDAASLVVVVTRVVPVDRGDHADVGLVELGDLGLSVADARVVLAGDLAVHVDAQHDRLAGLLGDLLRVLEGALELDQHRLLPLFVERRPPHHLAHGLTLHGAEGHGLLLLLGILTGLRRGDRAEDGKGDGKRADHGHSASGEGRVSYRGLRALARRARRASRRSVYRIRVLPEPRSGGVSPAPQQGRIRLP